MVKPVLETELIGVGDELVRGDILDINCSYLAKRLSLLGFKVVKVTLVGDNEQLLARLLEKYKPLRIVTGGLGPTFDDITRKVASRVLKRPLILNQRVLEGLKASYLNKEGVLLVDLERQSLFPLKAEPIPNPEGTAWGFYIKDTKSGSLFFLPGVPHELRAIFEQGVVPILKKEFQSLSLRSSHTFKVFGLKEARIEEKIKDILQEENPCLKWGLRVNFPEVWIDLSIEGEDYVREDVYKKILRKLKKRLYPYLFSTKGETIEEVIGKILKKKGITLFLAESLTGGLIGHMITSVPGSSDYFRGAIVAYHNEAKEKLLGVAPSTLQAYGAVSREVSLEMAEGAKRYGKAAIGLSVTGIAGPSGGRKGKPVGTVYIALAREKDSIVKGFQFSGDRNTIKVLAARWALEILRRYLEGIKD